jgi:polyisoprenoid-binding protein YceI
MRWMMTMVVAAGMTATVPAADVQYVLTKDNTKIEWTGTKPGGKHSGGFEKVSGTASITEKAGLTINVEIDCDSLYSDDKKLTGHLKSPDFFAVKDHPKAKFVSTKVAKADKGYVITGDLTLLGKKKEVSFPTTISTGDKFTMNGTIEINRSDFGMSYGKGKVDEKVTIRVSVDAKR